MTSVGNILLDKEILLESGTNELEILVFRLADYTFGINVAKVREVLPAQKITSLAKAHPSIVGVFRLRDTVIPCVSLRNHLDVEPSAEDEDIEQTLILTDFNAHQTAFVVDEVERIHRLSWKHVLAVPNLVALAETPVTAVARIDGRLVIMLDFEMVSDQVTEQFYRTSAVDNPRDLPRHTLRILLADDSPTVRQAIGDTLRASGYTQLTIVENGGQAWEWLQTRLAETDGNDPVLDLLISDVEMPQIDGFHLTRRVKEHPQLKDIPVLLYSSIVSPDNRKKGQAVGADAQVAKPELTKVVELADDLISSAAEKRSGHAPTPIRDETPKDDRPTGVLSGEAEPAVQAADQVNSPSGETAPSAAPPEIEPVAETVETVAEETPAETPPPDAIDPRLWRTFRTELGERVRNLSSLCEQAAAGDLSPDVLNATLRTLHTIKSASMVVPLDTATRVTHLMESLMEAASPETDQWPGEILDRYLDWLAQLADPMGDVAAVLSAGQRLEAELAAS